LLKVNIIKMSCCRDACYGISEVELGD